MPGGIFSLHLYLESGVFLFSQQVLWGFRYQFDMVSFTFQAAVNMEPIEMIRIALEII